MMKYASAAMILALSATAALASPESEISAYRRSHGLPAVTADPALNALAAKQAHAMARHFIHHPFQTGRKLRPGGHGLVVGDAVAIESRIARAAAEGVPERDIRGRLASESLRQRLAREPGAPARERHRAHVGDGGDAGVLEQGHEAIGRQVGMADGQELAGGGLRHWLDRVLRLVRA